MISFMLETFFRYRIERLLYCAAPTTIAAITSAASVVTAAAVSLLLQLILLPNGIGMTSKKLKSKF